MLTAHVGSLTPCELLSHQADAIKHLPRAIPLVSPNACVHICPCGAIGLSLVIGVPKIEQFDEL